MKKIYFACFFLSVSFTSLAQVSSGFSQKKQLKSVDDAKVKGFETINGSKTSSVPRLSQSISLNQTVNQKIVRDSTEGYVLFIENNAPATEASKQLRVSAEQLADNFIEKNKELLKLKSTKEELILVGSTTDESGTNHLRMQQHYNGVPIYGGEVVVHVKDSRVSSLNGRTFASASISTNPSIGKAQAIELAMTDVAKNAKIEPNTSSENSLFNFQKNTAELFIYYYDGSPKLAYQLTIRPNSVERWIYTLDAQTGEIIDKFNHTCTLDGIFKTSAKDLNGKTQEFRIYEKSGTYFLIDATQKMYSAERSKMPNEPVGALWTIDAQNSKIGGNMEFAHVTSSNGTNWSATAVSAHTNANTCYNYYVNTHGRNSLNGTGGNIVSVINILDDDGKGLDNAYWNGEFMGYGNGKDGFKPLAGALDVAGHEMTHGVIENTARLEYRNQSGALNESFADIFGVLIDRDDWTLGEDVVIKSVFPTGALRSLSDPNQGGSSLKSRGYQPKTMAQYVFLRDTPDEDNGGVHINSGIPNHAFYLFASNSNVGLSKAEKVYYQVITNYMTRTSKFIDLRLGVIQAAKTLYGETVAAAARQAFDAVGIVETTTTPTQPQTTPDIPTNPGTESLVVYDPVEETLYYGAFNQNQYTAFAKGYGCLSKPSVTDDGSYVYFVGKNKHIYRKDLRTTAAPVQLSEEALFRNVAISKDGKRLAALTAVADKFIYFFDFVNNTQVKFPLYNSTYSQGVSTGDALYADSFEWDYSGEYLIYDAFNQVKSLFGNVEYWDVGIMQAWNPSTNTFASGNIEKIFTNLERGDNIGNPAIAKTNPSILSFDYYDDNNQKNYIISVNLDNGSVQTVIENNDIGYPDYAKSDDKLAFNSLNNSKSIVRGIPMKSDKITPAGSAETYFTDAKWAVWYAQGQRQLPTKSAQTIAFTQIADQQPRAAVTLNATASSKLAIQYSIKSGDAALSGNKVTLGTTPGKVQIEAFQVGNSSFAAASTEQSFCIIPSTPTVSISGSTLTASGGQTYQWYINGNAIGGQTTQRTFPASFNGTFTVKAITADGCLSNASAGVLVQLAAPAIAWADISAGTFGSSFKAARSGANLFVLETTATTGNRTLKLKQFTTTGLASSQLLYLDNCSTCNSTTFLGSELYPTTDGGAIVYYQNTSNQAVIQKLNSGGSITWFKAISNYEFISAATGSNNATAIVLKATSGTDTGKHFLLYIAGSTGNEAWRLNLGTSAPNDVAVTFDEGIITTASDSTKSYSSLGLKRWAKKISSKKIKIIDTNEAFLQDANILTKVSLSTGTTLWTLNEPSLNSIVVTADKGVVIGTASRTLKISNTGSGVWTNTVASQKLQLGSDGTIGSVGVGSLASTATIFNADGTTLWQKQFTYNLSNTLTLQPAADNGWYATTHGQVPTKPNLNGTAFLYRILPVSTPCVYTVNITPNQAQVYCQSGTTTFQVAQAGLDLNYGLPASDYSITWLNGTQSLATNTLSYVNTAEGDFSARIQQGACRSVSTSVYVSIVGKQTPVATTDLIEQCLNGGSVSNLSATGCTNSSVLWSSGQTGATASVTPPTTTSYTAACVENYTLNGTARTCQSKSSPAVSVKVLAQSDMIIVGITAPSVLCDNETDTLKTYLGGTYYIPIQFEWTRNGTVISGNSHQRLFSEAGNYQLKAKDRRGCISETAVKTVEKSNLTISIDGNLDFCQGVSKNLTAITNGGIGSLLYDWRLNNTPISTISTVDVLTSGNYSLAVTDSKGCKKTATAQVTVNPKITGAFKNRSTVKGNLTYEFNENTLIGGTKPFKIVLNAVSASNQNVPIENTTIGKFTENSKIDVFVTDAKGCTLRDSIFIDYLPCNVGVSIAGDNTFCHYASATLNATPINGVQPMAYLWNRDNNLISTTQSTFKTNIIGNYTATITDSAKCVATSAEFKVADKGRDINAAITASGSLSVFSPSTITLTANNGTGFKHQWYRNDSLLTNQTEVSVVAKVTGNYAVQIEKDGCRDTSNVLTVTILTPLGIENGWYEGNVSAFPNPMDTYLTLKSATSLPSGATCQIYDSQGRLIYEEEATQKLTEQQFRINTMQWTSQTYHYRISTIEGTASGKLIKR